MAKHNCSLFISDIHLSVHRPEHFELFKSFILDNALNVRALYILGDLFDVWLGDDLMTEFDHQVANLLKQVKQAGVQTYLIPGNRDFLIGKQFAKLADITLLKDPTPQTIQNQSWLLSHGDKLCTADKLYQYYRKFVQSPIIKFLFLKLSRKYRQKIAQKLRNNSKRYQKNQPMMKLDVTEEGVQQCLKKSTAQILIHGHVHREKHQQHTVQQNTIDRYVLGTWHKTGSVIVADGDSKSIRHIKYELGQNLFD